MSTVSTCDIDHDISCAVEDEHEMNIAQYLPIVLVTETEFWLPHLRHTPKIVQWILQKLYILIRS